MENTISITEADYNTLCNLVKSERQSRSIDMQNLTFLGSEIKRARRVSGKRVQPDFVTMNSVVEVVDLDTNRELKVRLVYPRDADFRKGNISVLSMFGSALLGYGVGDIATYKAPRGLKRVRIKRITQPEAVQSMV